MDEAEIPRYQQSLARILSFVERLGAGRYPDVQPMAHPLPGLVQRLRADVATETDRARALPGNAPQVAAALYLVPKVIE